MTLFIQKLAIIITILLPLSVANAIVCDEENNSMAWVWNNSRKNPYKLKSETLYLLQGNFLQKNHTFFPTGATPQRIKKKLVLVFHLEELPSQNLLFITFLQKVAEWKAHNVEVTGVQLDFDTPIFKLKDYSDYLISLRRRLSSTLLLSISGSPEWMRYPAFQRSLKDSHITIFYQFFKGQKANIDTRESLHILKKHLTPFAVGLLPNQNIALKQRQELEANKNFKGLVCFYGERK